ncbi:MAG: hypothetical protein PHN89_03695 [Candidatus Pacebacteria bacterium]|nr:hypothetical protein [Candidatus Paceibacterota bacterium]
MKYFKIKKREVVLIVLILAIVFGGIVASKFSQKINTHSLASGGFDIFEWFKNRTKSPPRPPVAVRNLLATKPRSLTCYANPTTIKPGNSSTLVAVIQDDSLLSKGHIYEWYDITNGSRLNTSYSSTKYDAIPVTPNRLGVNYYKFTIFVNNAPNGPSALVTSCMTSVLVEDSDTVSSGVVRPTPESLDGSLRSNSAGYYELPVSQQPTNY